MNPVYAAAPLSGEGARRFGGRFNRVGRAALYTALTLEGVLREVNQVGDLQPTTIVAIRADIGPIFDGCSGAALRAEGSSLAEIGADDWHDRMIAGGAPSQALAERLIDAGYAGMYAPSYARAARAGDVNLILWEWDDTRLQVIDDDGRLG